MATYIDSGDITDQMMLETGFATKLAAKITKSDDAVEDMVKTMGLTSDSIETDPVPYLLKEWAIAWVGKEMCFDAMGKNNVDFPDLEKYSRKYEFYLSRVKDIQSSLNPAVITGSDFDTRDRATNNSGILFRN